MFGGATLNKDTTKVDTAVTDFTAKVWDAVSGDRLITLAYKHCQDGGFYAG
jgi:serine-threonine kinase receptor-associated protein